MRTGSKWRLTASIVVLLAAFAAAAAQPERAAAACEADVCMELGYVTDQNGVYTLVIAPWMLAVLPEELRDCVWEVEAQFSDGSPPEHHVFDATETFSSSHQFPEPGTYLVTILATDGIQADNGEPCPTIQIDATVVYPEPSPPPPPPPPPPPEPSEEAAPDPAAQPPAAGPGKTGSDGAPRAASYWRSCGRIQAHAVGCRKARKVVGAARSILSRARSERLAKGATFRAAGFSCRLRQGGKKPLACRQGKRRILAPLG